MRRPVGTRPQRDSEFDCCSMPAAFRSSSVRNEREASPHLRVFDLPEQFDDGIIVGRGRIAAAPVLLAAQEGRFMGGAFGEVHGAKLTGLLRAARDIEIDPGSHSL